MKVSLFGPPIDLVNAFIRTLPGARRETIAWEEFPEILVKCGDDTVAEALCAEFGPAVHSVQGAPFARTVCGALVASGLTLATAESCTGGLAGHMVTSVAGSSACYLGGVVTYANEAKTRLLAIPGEVVERNGAVSRQVAEAMAEGVRGLLSADIGVAISGIAGPGGGTPEKPVGTVWLALAATSGTTSVVLSLAGNRTEVKTASAFFALDMVRRYCLRVPMS